MFPINIPLRYLDFLMVIAGAAIVAKACWDIVTG